MEIFHANPNPKLHYLHPRKKLFYRIPESLQKGEEHCRHIVGLGLQRPCPSSLRSWIGQAVSFQPFHHGKEEEWKNEWWLGKQIFKKHAIYALKQPNFLGKMPVALIFAAVSSAFKRSWPFFASSNALLSSACLCAAAISFFILSKFLALCFSKLSCATEIVQTNISLSEHDRVLSTGEGSTLKMLQQQNHQDDYYDCIQSTRYERNRNF